MEKIEKINILENLIKSNDICKVKEWFITYHETIYDNKFFYFIKFVKDFEMFSTIFNMYEKEIMVYFKKHKTSLLTHAITEGKDLKIIEVILNLDKECINTIDLTGNTPFLWAVIQNKDISLLKFLLENNADVNISGVGRKTPLQSAKTLEVVKLLIENGARINYPDEIGCVPIMDALRHARGKEIILELIEKGSDMEVRNAFGQTCLHLALKFKYDEDVINRICCKTLDYNLEDKEGLTPLCYALNDDNWRMHPPYKINFINELIKKGFVVNNDVIMHAVKHCKNIALIGSLTKYGDIRCVDKYGNCLLHHAYNIRLIKVLVCRGAHINHEDEEGKTPLTKAIFQQKDTKIIESLLFWGSDIKNILFNFGYNSIFSDSVYDLLILFGMSVSLKNNLIKCLFSRILHSIVKCLPVRLSCGLLRHIFISNENVKIPDDLQMNDNLKYLFESYNNELNKMKDEMFTNNVSYYSFCTKQYRSIRSQFVCKGFTTADHENLKKQFPTFFNEIAIKIKINIKINERKNILKKLFHVQIFNKQINKECNLNNSEDCSRMCVGLDSDSMYMVSCYLNDREINCVLAAAII